MIRDMRDSDLETAHRINEASPPDVDSVDRPAFDRLYHQSALCLVAVDPTDTVVGFCMIAAAGSSEVPPRTARALDRDDAMLHLDRVAFARGGGGQGLGPALYDEIDARIESGAVVPTDGPIRLTSWFSVEPLNQHALDFYLSRRFIEIERHTFGPATLALMQKVYSR
jgi:ribosomal protein S18 acetylase RimI-like enzyme